MLGEEGKPILSGTNSKQNFQEYQSCSNYTDNLNSSRQRSKDSHKVVESTRPDNSHTREAIKSQSRKPKIFIEYILDFFPASNLLENKASVARDHLANERTFLSWLRTSLTLISIGIAITQIFHLEKMTSKMEEESQGITKMGKRLGLIFILIGLSYLIFALIRYFHIQVSMTKGYFPASRSTVLISTLFTFSALMGVFVVLNNR